MNLCRREKKSPNTMIIKNELSMNENSINKLIYPIFVLFNVESSQMILYRLLFALTPDYTIPMLNVSNANNVLYIV